MKWPNIFHKKNEEKEERLELWVNDCGHPLKIYVDYIGTYTRNRTLPDIFYQFYPDEETCKQAMKEEKLRAIKSIEDELDKL